MCAVRVYDERTPSRLRVTVVVLFYMISALVVRLFMISHGPQSRISRRITDDFVLPRVRPLLNNYRWFL